MHFWMMSVPTQPGLKLKSAPCIFVWVGSRTNRECIDVFDVFNVLNVFDLFDLFDVYCLLENTSFQNESIGQRKHKRGGSLENNLLMADTIIKSSVHRTHVIFSRFVRSFCT